ncbi:MAG: hypothetical protein WC320_00450 [Candidatus Paceibacterota bacterium]
MKKVWIIIGVIAVIAIVVILTGVWQPKEPEELPSEELPEELPSAEEQPAATEPVQCTAPECLAPQFLNCNPAELKMPFMEGTTYIITVFGAEDGKCHYTGKVVDQSGNVPLTMQATECFVPLEKVTMATLEHLFGANKTEAAKAEQDKIEADYCIKQ